MVLIGNYAPLCAHKLGLFIVSQCLENNHPSKSIEYQNFTRYNDEGSGKFFYLVWKDRTVQGSYVGSPLNTEKSLATSVNKQVFSHLSRKTITR
jgi:hypothetical protein